jgi:hypothetical protein
MQQQIRRRSAADTSKLRAPPVLNLLDALLERCRVVDCARARASESANPQVEAVVRFLPRSRAAIARGGQAIDVIVGPGSQDQRDGRQHARCQPAPAEHKVDQPAPSPPVTVGERVNCLELGMGESGLRDGRQRIPVAEGAQIRQQVRYKLWRRRYECCRAGVVGAAADPVLLLPQLPGMLSVPEADHQAAMEPEQCIHRDLIARTDLADRAVHGVDVAENLLSSDVGSPLAEVMCQLCAKQFPGTDLQAFDARRGNGFGAQQETSQRLGVR